MKITVSVKEHETTGYNTSRYWITADEEYGTTVIRQFASTKHDACLKAFGIACVLGAFRQRLGYSVVIEDFDTLEVIRDTALE